MKIRRNVYDVAIEACCLLCLVGLLIYLAIVWESIPEEIPGHYNAMGQIDRITSKGSLLALPIITWIMYIGMTIIGRFPQVWNTGVTITQENKEKVYRILKSLLGTVKFIVVAIFTYLTVNSSMVKPLPAAFLPISLCLLFGSLIFFIVRLMRVK